MKYYFAYHSFHDRIFAMAWVEQDGHAIVGRPLGILPDTKREITEEEFNISLSDLEKKYPIPLPSLDKPASG